ncbi:MAG: hypothetical protein Q7U71_05875 [bacterium]|nr:hypothetical protein [bacterium]
MWRFFFCFIWLVLPCELAFTKENKCEENIPSSIFKELFAGASTGAPGEHETTSESLYLTVKEVKVYKDHTEESPLVTTLSKQNGPFKADSIAAGKYYSDTRANIWYHINISTDQGGWVNSEFVLVPYDIRALNATLVKDIYLFTNYKEANEGGVIDVYLVFGDFKEYYRVVENSWMPRQYYRSDTLFIRYLENTSPGWLSNKTGNTITVIIHLHPGRKASITRHIERKNIIKRKYLEY